MTETGMVMTSPALTTSGDVRELANVTRNTKDGVYVAKQHTDTVSWPVSEKKIGVFGFVVFVSRGFFWFLHTRMNKHKDKESLWRDP